MWYAGCSLCIHSSSDGHLDVSALCPVNSTAESIQMYISVRFVFSALGLVLRVSNVLRAGRLFPIVPFFFFTLTSSV